MVRTSPTTVDAAAIGTADNFRASLVAEKIPDASERETQLGIRARSDLICDEVGFRKCGGCDVRNPRKVLSLGSAAEQDAEAQSIGHGAQQNIAGIQAAAGLVDIGLVGVHQAEVAKELTLRALVPQFASNDQRGLEVIPSLVESGQTLVDHSEIA